MWQKNAQTSEVNRIWRLGQDVRLENALGPGNDLVGHELRFAALPSRRQALEMTDRDVSGCHPLCEPHSGLAAFILLTH